MSDAATQTAPDAAPVRRGAAGARIGHVHLEVADIERALGSCCGVLGFEPRVRYGNEAAFVSAGACHHHIGLNTTPTPEVRP